MARSAVYVRQKKLDAALADREIAVQLDPKNPEVYVARGGSYHLLGQHQKGFDDRTRAIGLAPNSALGWTARGDAYYLLERWDEALADLDQAVKLDPDNAETRQLRNLAEKHVKDKIAEDKAKEAAPETQKVTLPPTETAAPVEAAAATVPAAAPVPAPTPVAPPRPVTPPPPPLETKAVLTADDYHQQGRKDIQEDKFAEAIEALNKALDMNPYLATAFNARGYAHFRLKQYKEAIADFDAAIKLNPLYGNAFTNRASAKRAAGDKAGADADQAKARDLIKNAK
jgi:tetratricopeptide (TPR) repeat protein